MNIISGMYNFVFGNQIAQNRHQETPSLAIKIFGIVSSILLITGGALASSVPVQRRRVDAQSITPLDHLPLPFSFTGSVTTVAYGVCTSELKNGAERFCDKVVETMSLLNKSPHVLHVNDLQNGYLFGDSETARSLPAKELVTKLSRERGYTVWSMDSTVGIHPGRLIALWKRCDLMVLDGIDAEQIPLAEAAITFARRYKKMILATGKNAPFTLFSSNVLSPEGDLIQVLEV